MAMERGESYKDYIKRSLRLRAAIVLGALIGTGLGVGAYKGFEVYTAHQPGLYVKANGESLLYGAPNDLGRPIGKIHNAEPLTAECYYESATLGVDSVRVSNIAHEGYIFVKDRLPSGTIRLFGSIDNLSVTAQQLEHNLPKCS